MKHIFVSQSEFDMGRNRGNKRLIAILDGVKLKPTELPESSFCQHVLLFDNNQLIYCVIPSNRKCLFGGDCRVARFYDRNPKYGRNNG